MVPIILASIDWKSPIFAVVGGIGIFLFGINVMSDSLKKIAGSKLKLFVEKTTNTPFKGILVGILLTALIQSSAATSALVVGLVSAGLMTLPQAVGVIFGANIGTTTSSILISLNIGNYSLPIIFVGAILIFFVKRKKVQYFGRVLLGFGMLFFGLNLMGGALEELSTLPQFLNFLQSLGDKPLLGLLVGVLTTAVIQSSSATIGILQQIYSTGTMSLIGATSIVLGDNIGTTVTSVMAASGGSLSAKKTALVHVLFNTIGAILFFNLITPYTYFIIRISTLLRIDYLNSKFTISLVHVFFNIGTVLILFWVVKQIVWLVNKIIPAKDDIISDDVILDKLLLKSAPDLALENAKKAIVDMGNVTYGMLEYAYRFSFENNEKAYKLAFQSEEISNSLDVKIHNYLVEIGSKDLNKRQMLRVAKDIDTITDLERIGDHLENIIEFFEERKTQKLELNQDAEQEFKHLFEIVRAQLENSLESYFTNNQQLAKAVEEQEFELNKLVKKYRNNHIMRIRDNNKENGTSYYVDILSNLERIGDHTHNIAENVLSEKFSHRVKAIK